MDVFVIVEEMRMLIMGVFIILKKWVRILIEVFVVFEKYEMLFVVLVILFDVFNGFNEKVFFNDFIDVFIILGELYI